MVHLLRPGTPEPPLAPSLQDVDALPEDGLFVEARLLKAQEVAARDDAHDPATVDNRHMAEAAVLHQP